MTIFNHLSINKLQVIAIVFLEVFNISQSYSQNISQWRGINRDGFYNETELLKNWQDNNPKLLWFTEEIGNGYAAPSILNDRVFINGEIDSVSYLFAFDLKGKMLWKSPNGKEFMGADYSSNFPGARSTPTIIDNLAYACSGNGRIACYETSDGTEKWAIEMVEGLGGYKNEFGYSESLVVDNSSLYCFPGGDTVNIAALDRFTGKVIWTSKALGDTTSFCSPLLIKFPAQQILVTASRHYLFGVDCENGELLWSYKLNGFKYDGEHCNTPIYRDGHIYYITAEDDGKGAVKLELSPDGKSIKEIWHNNKIRNAFGGFVIDENNLFTTIQKNYLYSVDIKNGNVVDSVKTKYGSLIHSDNKFISYGMNGVVTLINYEQNKFQKAGELKIEKGTKEHLSHPVLANGVLYIRHGKALMAYKII